MIDRSRAESQPLKPPMGIPIPGLVESESPSGPSVADLYDKLFSEPVELATELNGGQHAHEVPRDAPAATAPPAPLTLRQTGLTLGTISDLILKQLYLQGNLLGIQFARQMRLPFTVVEEGLKFLKDDKCIEVASGDLVGRSRTASISPTWAASEPARRSSSAATSDRPRFRSTPTCPSAAGRP